MVIAGVGKLEKDGITRPLVEVLFDLDEGRRESELFLVDSGADCSVLTDHLVAKRGLKSSPGSQLVGLGGTNSSGTVTATLTSVTTAGQVFESAVRTRVRRGLISI
jgi:Aspartyl protease